MALKLSKSQLREWLSLLRNNAKIGFAILNGEGRILATDTQILDIWGYSATKDKELALEGRHIDEVIKTVNPLSEMLEEVKRTGHVMAKEYPFIDTNGSAKWAMVEGWILQESDEDIITGWSWIDITSIYEITSSDYIKMLEETLNHIFRDIPLMFFFWEITEDNRTKILGVNKQGESVLGYSASEIVGKDYIEFAIPDAWKTAVQKYVADMRNNPKPYLGEHPLIIKSGEAISVRWLDVPVELPMFNRIWVVSIGEDIRERLKMERELRESEERYRRIVDAITDYFYHVKISNGQAVETIHSPGCVAVTGYTPEDFYQNPYLWYEIVYDEDKELVLNYANALARGEDPGPIIHRIVRKDGQVRWVKNTCLLLFDRNRNYLGYDSLIQDVTAELLAQEELKKSEKFYRGIIENLAEGYFEIDLEGKIKFANPAFLKLLGKDVELLPAKTKIFNYLEPEDRDRLENILNDIKEKRKRMDLYEWKIKTDAGDRIVECSLFPLFTRQEKVKGFSGILRDITERKKQEEQIRQLQKWESLGTIVSGIAHDFNNLLMAIQGNVELEETEYPNGDVPSQVIPYHSEIRNAVDRAKELCWQMMICAGKEFAIQKKLHNLNKIIYDMLPVLHPMIPEKITLRLNLCEEDTSLFCDEILVRQVILSLVTNSVEAIGNKEGLVTIFTRVLHYNRDMFASFVLDGKNLPEGKYVELVIEDTGSGIKPENIAKIFDPFYSSKFLGRGLGLSSVLGIVRSHKGGMKVESTVGVGTKMYVVFPYAYTETPAEKDTKGKRKDDTPIQEVVLVVEKDFALRELTKRILLMRGFNTVAVGDNQSAIEMLTSPNYKVKIVVLDIGLPEKEGQALLSEMRQRGIRVPVILSSSFLLEDIEKEFRDLVVCSLLKPYIPAEIINAVKDNWEKTNNL